MYCSNCGNKVKESFNYCPSCGKEIYKESEKRISLYKDKHKEIWLDKWGILHQTVKF